MRRTQDVPQHGSDRRVLMIAYDFPPATTAGVNRTLRFVKYLPDFGWQPIVVTVQPGARLDRCDPESVSRIPSSTAVTRTDVWRPEESIKRALHACDPRRLVRRGGPGNVASEAAPRPLGAEAKPRSNVIRAVSDLLFATPDMDACWILPALWAVVREVRRHHPQIIYATGPPFSAHAIGAMASLLTGLPLVLDYRDPMARPPWGPRKVYPASQRVVVRLEASCVRQASRAILATERLADDFRLHYPRAPRQKFAAISNGYDPELLSGIREHSATSRPSGAKPVTLLHPGSLYDKRDPTRVLEAMRALADSGLVVHLQQLGPVSPRIDLPRLIERFGLVDQVRVEDALPYDRMLERMASVDLFLLLQPGTDLQVPGKLYEMLLFRRPIVAVTTDGATADIVRNYRVGSVGNADSAASIAAAIREASQAIDRSADEEGWNAALRDFDGRGLTWKLAQILESAVVNPRGQPQVSEA